MLKSGDKIGPYQLLNKLGSGTFGVVWKAKNIEARKAREVALKIPRDDEIDLNAIDAEAEIWLKASGHPNVLPFIEAGMYDDYLVIVSEFAPDGSLQGWLDQHDGKAPSIEAAVEMTRGILSGLEHLHQQRIIHRDLKPDNILLQGETPRLVDFGISRIVKSTSMSANIAGTPVYMAPEAFQRKRNEQTDVWSVGVMLYQMLTGQLPFEGDDIATIYVAVRDQEMLPLPDKLPLWLREIVTRALTKDPAQRYQSASEMRRDLTEAKQRYEQAERARQRQQAEQQQHEKEAQLQAERERLQRENADLQRRLAQQQREQVAQVQPPMPEPQRPPALASTLLNEPPPAVTPEARRVVVPLDEQPKPPNTKPSRRLLLVGGALTVLINVASLISWNSRSTDNSPASSSSSPPATINTPSPAFISSSNPFEFETVSLDASGKEIERKKKTARYFTEDLGNGVTLEIVSILGGTFTMGSLTNESNRYDNEGPQHLVTVPAFAMGKYEITQQQWQALMNNNPANFKGEKLPVESVSWKEAKEFCAKLSSKTGKTYRLPSEAEWEYAARAGTITPFAFGGTVTPQFVNYNGNYPYASAPKGEFREKTIPVGSLGAANAFGLFDLHGNVYEWCEDVWHENYNGAPTDGSAWTSGADQSHHVLRGGSWSHLGGFCRSAARYALVSGGRDDALGFRVVVSARTQ